MLTPHQLRIRQLNRRVYLFFASIILLAIGFFAIKAFIERPTDLGPKLEYIGMNFNAECLLVPCDGALRTTYYFATDMNQTQIRSYFKKATFVPINESYNQSILDFAIHNSKGGRFSISYAGDATDQANGYGLKLHGKTYLVSMKDSDYQLAKDSL